MGAVVAGAVVSGAVVSGGAVVVGMVGSVVAEAGSCFTTGGGAFVGAAVSAAGSVAHPANKNAIKATTRSKVMLLLMGDSFFLSNRPGDEVNHLADNFGIGLLAPNDDGRILWIF